MLKETQSQIVISQKALDEIIRLQNAKPEQTKVLNLFINGFG
jgi:hypothetical protein